MRQPSTNMSLFFKETTNGRLFTMGALLSWWHTSPYLVPLRRRGTTLEGRCLDTRRTRVGKSFSHLYEHVEHIIEPVNGKVPHIHRYNDVMSSNEGALREGADVRRTIEK